MAPDAAPLDKDSVVTLGSAGKFVTHIAALQLVEKGLVGIDEPVYAHLPEMEKFEIISKNEGPDAETKPYLLRPATKKITLRHLLTHSCGISWDGETPELKAWKEAQPPFEPDTSMLVQLGTMPLLFEPGEGFSYGSSIHWTVLLISRVTKASMRDVVKQSIFEPLGMTLTTYPPMSPEAKAKWLQAVERQADGSLQGEEDEPMDLSCSITDMGKLLADLIAPTSKILGKDLVELLFTPAFSKGSPALRTLQGDNDTYGAPSGVPKSMVDPPVNYTVAGLLTGGTLPLSGFPAGTLTWNGAPNVVWAMNREKGLASFWATQLSPVDDPQAVEVMLEFSKGVWAAS